jgi:hypothetical protein
MHPILRKAPSSPSGTITSPPRASPTVCHTASLCFSHRSASVSATEAAVWLHRVADMTTTDGFKTDFVVIP